MSNETIEIVDTEWTYKAERDAGWLLGTTLIKVPEGYLKVWWHGDREGRITFGLGTTDRADKPLVVKGFDLGFDELVKVDGQWIFQGDMRMTYKKPQSFRRLVFLSQTLTRKDTVSPGQLGPLDIEQVEAILTKAGRSLVESGLVRAMSVYGWMKRRAIWVEDLQEVRDLRQSGGINHQDATRKIQEANKIIQGFEANILADLTKPVMAILLNHPDREVRRQCLILKASEKLPGSDFTNKPGRQVG